MHTKRKDVVRVAEKDPNYGRCGTCRHYQDLMVCSKCSHLNKYSFAWRDYVIQNPDKFTSEDDVKEEAEKYIDKKSLPKKC